MKMTWLMRQVVFVFALLACHTVFAQSYDAALQHWRQVLQQYVDEQGRINFIDLSEDREDLEQYIRFINEYSPASHPDLFGDRQQIIAYHLNTYNALAMHGVLDKGIPDDFDSIFKRLAFFKLKKVTIGGRQTSLYDFENDVIRALGDERIHFALNCMVRDCPRLPREPFTAAGLEQQLADVTREFFSKENHIHVDHDRNTVWLSEILDFYTEDFVPSGRAADLLPYVNRFVESPLPAGYRVRFIDYDWTINQSPQ